MLKPLTPLAVVLAALALAGPAAAQAPVTDTTPAPVCSGVGENDPGSCTSGDQQIGQGQVITDPANQVTGPTTPDDGDRPADTPPKRGEQHVLGDAATASSPAPAAAPAPAPTPVAAAAPAPRSATATATATSAKTLPFTGVNAGPLVLMGVLLLGSGLLLRRRLEA